MIKLYARIFAVVFLGSLALHDVAAQKITPHPNAVRIALDYALAQQSNWQLTKEDVNGLAVQNFYSTDHNGVTHVYLIQTHAGIELYNAIVNVNVMPDGSVLYAGNRAMTDLASAVNTTQATLSAEEAVKRACAHLQIDLKEPLKVAHWYNKNEMAFEKGTFSLSEINVKLRYQRLNDKQVRLAWDLNIEPLDAKDHWSLRIDALTGEVLDKISWTTHCSFHPGTFSHPQGACTDAHHAASSNAVVNELVVGEGSYRVFQFPAESPAHGSRTLINSPADAQASPFGWHDTNGAAGVEYNITRGNNVHAYLDWTNTNVSRNDEPNGGASLVFDYPFNANAEPDSNRNAAVTNLFYVNNAIHDVAFRYGFNEAAANFQQTNYSAAGRGNDYVQAEAQDGAKAATPTLNNANFSTPPDGSRPRMQMYVWSRQGDKLLKVTAPSNLVGDIETSTASFGQTIGTTPTVGEVVVVTDGSSNASQGCNALINTNLTGRIALVDRGNCEFGRKALNAQQKGAIGVIICNFEETLVSMGPGAVGSQVSIPVVMIKKSDCDRIRVTAGSGLRVSIGRDATVTGPDQLDGDFDNGIIAHEYTHGISNRLTGGGTNAGCLSTSEQAAGEGWSDFLALVMTAKPSDRGNVPRGVGTYVLRQPNSGVGIRRFQYTTDMKVNPLTYDDIIINDEVHDVGEVWAATIWDLYWAMVDLYGWDANLTNTNSGNGRALKLVFDGMKLQPCNPGFLDCRDAILAADRANFGGQNQCLIWDVFARRGFGFNSAQGAFNSKADNTEGFDKNPFCDKRLKVEKFATENIKPGDPITYTIRVINHKDTRVTGVVVSDNLPAGTTYINNSANRTVTVSSGVLRWNIDSIRSLDTAVLTFRVNTDPARRSIAQFMDGFENGDRAWDYEDLKITGNIWSITDFFANTGTKAMSVEYATGRSSDQIVKTLNSVRVTGSKPVLRFYHKYDTEPGNDGGFVQVSTNNGQTWENVGDKFFRTPYRGGLAYGTFAIPNLRGFWGDSKGFVQSCVDLSSYSGRDIKVRFRFGTDSLIARTGWFLDDFAIMDMYNYNSTVRVTSAQNDTASAEVGRRGTIVEPTLSTSTKDLNEELTVKVFPNPASDYLNINILGEKAETVDIAIFSADGRQMWRDKVAIFSKSELVVPVNTSAFPSGMYFVKINTSDASMVEKIVKH